MAKRNKFRARIESIHEEDHLNAGGWGDTSGTGWDQGQGGWGQNGRPNESDQNQDGWQNAAARDNYVQPGDSISNASSNTDWEPVAPTPPAKDVQMHSPANGWGWGSNVNEPVEKSAMKGRNQRSSAYGSPGALGMQSMLSTITEQRQMQHNELAEQIRQIHQHAQDVAFAHQNPERGRSKHVREGNTSLGAGWGQVSDVGTLPSNRAPAETNMGDGAWNNPQDSNGIGNWAGTADSTTTKSKKKPPKGGRKQVNMSSVAENKNDAWGDTAGQPSWGAAGGWDSAPATTSVASGGFGANTDGWGQTMSNGNPQAPAATQSQSWNAWGDNGTQQNEVKGKTPKSGLSRFFSRIFGGKGRKKKKEEKTKQKELEKTIWAEDTKANGRKGKAKDAQAGKKGNILKKPKFAEPEAIAYPAAEQEEDEDDFDEDSDADWGDVGGWVDSGKGWTEPVAAPKRTSRASARASDGWNNAWNAAPHTRTSKTLAFATDERQFDAGRPRSGGHVVEHRIVESHHQALAPASAALFSKERLARDRILWFFDPDKDPRVSSVLTWIQHMQVPLATFGFSKFLETKERGALFTNVEFRSPSAPQEPAFDWITFDQIQATMDKIFQESLAFYDPSSQIIVFVFLLSKSRRSMAVWRRKLPLPEITRHTYGTQITKLLGNLNRQYPIHVDEIPAASPADQNRGVSNTMKKWLAWGR